MMVYTFRRRHIFPQFLFCVRSSVKEHKGNAQHEQVRQSCPDEKPDMTCN